MYPGCSEEILLLIKSKSGSLEGQMFLTSVVACFFVCLQTSLWAVFQTPTYLCKHMITLKVMEDWTLDVTVASWKKVWNIYMTLGEKKPVLPGGAVSFPLCTSSSWILFLLGLHRSCEEIYRAAVYHSHLLIHHLCSNNKRVPYEICTGSHLVLPVLFMTAQMLTRHNSRGR